MGEMIINYSKLNGLSNTAKKAADRYNKRINQLNKKLIDCNIIIIKLNNSVNYWRKRVTEEMEIIDLLNSCIYEKIEEKIKLHYGTKEIDRYKKLYYYLRNLQPTNCR